MSHTIKFWERVIKHRLRNLTTISKNQFGFMPRRSIMEAIFLTTYGETSGIEEGPTYDIY
jgi:hypothetical protein